ncbi:hypothetical protein chiPu_0030592, partial [Chiloscyllium punctatum]|nr:hypothetical protein [Chiloscyllium punctatum]
GFLSDRLLSSLGASQGEVLQAHDGERETVSAHGGRSICCTFLVLHERVVGAQKLHTLADEIEREGFC